jgi:hypothetical protein
MRDYYLYDYDAIFSDGVININNGKFKFKEIGLKNIITCVAALKLTHTMAVKQTQDYLQLVRRISKNTSPFLFCSRAYVGLYLDKILKKDHSIRLFNDLLNKTYERDTFLVDYELDDFISDSIVDYINYDGELHYPSFLLKNLSNHFFKSIKEGDLETFFLNLKLEKNDFIHDKIFLLMKDDYSFNFIDPDAYRFVLRIFHFKYSGSSEFLSLFRFGLDYSKRNQAYQNNIKQIEKLIKKIIDNGLNLERKRGIKR